MTDEDGADDPEHGLPAADLQYPTLEFDEGRIDDDGSFDLATEADRETMSEVAEGVAGALASHDLAVETEAGYVAFGVGPKSAAASFDAEEGELTVTLQLSAKAMAVDDGTGEAAGARGDAGFVPESMLTDDGDNRCYGWIDDPESPE
ncbi:hypothetical protein SY89_01695 [Halolamina pelagica]|uniref:Amphi-Trp domain-containing protein n=1 Tax=Halolamina pelagica TaxID=699431 RepID=A0A0P7GZB5_9EURY|nr:hypothetical protein [Halolamina pelagica]KPN30954.1 hypothetical protein SY89_01695 [Halolamina pelagica]